jgi:peptidyl-dipeptidase Dcp
MTNIITAWCRTFGDVPPLNRIRTSDFKPAFDTALRDQLAGVDRIVSNPAPPDFENTIVALERAEREMRGLQGLLRLWSSAMSSRDFQEVEREIMPQLAALSDRVTQNEGLFLRVEAVHESREHNDLTPEQKRLAWFHHRRFLASGAHLDPEAQARLREINHALASLFPRFRQNVVADETDRFLHLADAADLAGVPETLRKSAAEAATERGLDGWVIQNNRSAMEMFLTFADRRDLRRKVWEMFVSRGGHPGEHDNRPIVERILSLRAERATLLGFPSHAHLRLADAMASRPERAVELLTHVWSAAIGQVPEDLSAMREVGYADGLKGSIQPWDLRYYAERLRRDRYGLDQNAMRPYLQLDRLREGMFWVAGRLFGLRFQEAKDIPVHHPDVRVWRVVNGKEENLGFFHFDAFARKGKRFGASMDVLRPQARLDEPVSAIVTNICSFTKATADHPTLISWAEARVLFHEFGHALHGLASDVTYPSLSGPDVARDYVEFPSQVFERWLSSGELLERFARHVETDEPIPQDLVDRIARVANFNQATATLEYLASALMDLRIHMMDEIAVGAACLERDILAELRMPDGLVPIHRIAHFHHAFGGDLYSGSYYSYLWADALSADAAEAFLEGGGMYDRTVAGRLWDSVLSRGNSVDPSEGYRDFRGRGPDPEALMRKRGFESRRELDHTIVATLRLPASQTCPRQNPTSSWIPPFRSRGSD